MSIEAVLITGIGSVASALVSVWLIVVSMLRREQSARDLAEKMASDLAKDRLADYERMIERYHQLSERSASAMEKLSGKEGESK